MFIYIFKIKQIEFSRLFSKNISKMNENYESGIFWEFARNPQFLESSKTEKKESGKEEEEDKNEEEGEGEESTPNPRNFMLDFMKKRNIKGKLLFSMISGSWCYNLNLPTSDFDFIGVYVAPTANLLSLGKLKTTHHQTDPDVILYELRDFCMNLMKGNPLLISLLYSSRYMVETPEWEELKKYRNLFVTEKSIKAYFGYHEAELRQVMKRGAKTYSKVLFHAFRLLFEIESILSGKGPIVFFDESEERKLMMKIRTEEESEEKKKEYLSQIGKKKEELKKLEKEVTTSEGKHLLVKDMTEKGNKRGFDALNSWLIKLRKENF